MDRNDAVASRQSCYFSHLSSQTSLMCAMCCIQGFCKHVVQPYVTKATTCELSAACGRRLLV